MALIDSRSLKRKEDVPMADKVAKQDITVENAAGQTVVVVPAGQPIPDDIDEQKKRIAGAGITSASEDEIKDARKGSGQQPT